LRLAPLVPEILLKATAFSVRFRRWKALADRVA
jgi:hypothetical protein